MRDGFEAVRDSAVQAVIQAEPYDTLSQSTYDKWKGIDINFDLREVVVPLGVLFFVAATPSIISAKRRYKPLSHLRPLC